jgi:hypothetical protein
MLLWIALGGLGLYALTRKPAAPEPGAGTTDTGAPNTGAPAAPSIVVDKSGGQISIPPPGIDAMKVLKDVMSVYRRSEEPARVVAGPLAGTVEFTYVLTPTAPQITDQSEAATFARAGLLLNNPSAEPIVMILRASDVADVFAGKRPDPLKLYIAPRTLANKICAPGSPYVLVGVKPL